MEHHMPAQRPGGDMVGCPLLKAMLVRSANFTLHHLARVPTRDASNGFRLFSRRVRFHGGPRHVGANLHSP